MKKFVFASIIVTSLLANAAQAISCPPVPAGHNNGDIITVDGLQWRLAIGTPDSLNVTTNGITWPHDYGNGYRYFLYRRMPICEYSAPNNPIILTTSLRLLTGAAIGWYMCQHNAPKSDIDCATNSFIPDMRGEAN